MTVIDPMAPTAGRGGAPRDHRGRALLKPRGMDTRVPYTPASSLAEYIENRFGLERWEKRYLAIGLGRRPDLAAMAGAEVYTTGFDDVDAGENEASGRRLDAIISTAQEHAGIREKANWGTAGHLLTEPGQRERGGYVPPTLEAAIEQWDLMMRGVDIVATEVFVANDTLMSAGTFDHLIDGSTIDPACISHLDVRGTLLVVDKKFGKLKPRPFGVQTWVYAGGEPYGLGDELDQRWTYEEKFGKPVNTRVGLIAHVPFDGSPARLIPIDLEKGRRTAELAAALREARRDDAYLLADVDTKALARHRARSLLTDASTEQEMAGIYQAFADVWTDSLTRYGQERLNGLA